MFNEIIDQMDTLCLETAQKCKGAYENLRACEDASRAKQRPDESEVKYKARMATAAAALEDAQKLQRDLDFNLPHEAEEKGNSLRRQLEVAIAEKFSANPSDVDPNTLTLLQSGILRPSEYVRLYERATNSTMRRLIGKYAGEAAKNDQDTESARILRNVDYMSRNGSGGGYLAAFDGLLDILKRAAKNPTFYDSYSKLAAPFLAVFRS